MSLGANVGSAFNVLLVCFTEVFLHKQDQLPVSRLLSCYLSPIFFPRSLFDSTGWSFANDFSRASDGDAIHVRPSTSSKE